MRVAVLTSSRADYGIYLPLLKKLREDHFFELYIIAFGTHHSKKFGNTVDQITNDGFTVNYLINTLPAGDQAADIAESMGKTMIAFAPVWEELSGKVDLVFCLGDRYEMFAAVASSVPFNIRVAHIHGGETTLGAIDDCFRHSISLMSHYHFTVAEPYRKRVVELIGRDENVYNVGSLSYDNLKGLSLLSIDELKQTFNVDLALPSILITFNPETVSFEKNEFYIQELIKALQQTRYYQFIITMPNADTMGNMIREKLILFSENNGRVKLFESLGTVGYLSCMKHCAFMLGNTSSGFAEAAFFPKYVINLGDRQKGRVVTQNINNCRIDADEITRAIQMFEQIKLPGSIDIYGTGNSANTILTILKNIHG